MAHWEGSQNSWARLEKWAGDRLMVIIEGQGRDQAKFSFHPVGHRDQKFVPALGPCKTKVAPGEGLSQVLRFLTRKNGANLLISFRNPSVKGLSLGVKHIWVETPELPLHSWGILANEITYLS